MCLILIACQQHAEYPLVIAANRDEFYGRQSEPAGFWTMHPSVLAGIDKVYGGTWLGINKYGRFAAVANYRELVDEKKDALSRGFLVRDFLIGDLSPATYATMVAKNSAQYNGFNLIVGDQTSLYFCSNHVQYPQQLETGMYGISNGALDYPWPKVTRGKTLLDNYLRSHQRLDAEVLLDLLADKQLPDDKDLPDTGIGLEQERLLAPIFVSGESYGTRCSTLIYFDNDRKVNFVERNFNRDANTQETVRYTFQMEIPVQ